MFREPRVSIVTMSGIALLAMACLALDVHPTLPERYRSKVPAAQIKTTEQYWAETGLQPSELASLLNPSICQSDERQFLACASAVVSVAQKYGAAIDKAGHVKLGLDSTSRQIFAEKDLLASWQKIVRDHKENAASSPGRFSATLPAVPFLKVWETLVREFIPKGHESYATGIGINSFFSVAEDPHTYILPSDYYSQVIAKASHRSASIGLVIGRNDQHYYVKKVLDESSAEQAGLKKGDVLSLLNGKPAKALSPYEVSHELKGAVGTLLELAVIRDRKTISVSILRTERSIQTVSSHVLEGAKPVGVLTINKFASGTCESAKSALQLLIAQNITGLLLDLRDNPGGQMTEAACITGLFIGPGKSVYETKLLGAKDAEEVTYTHHEQLYQGPLAILINSGSASAAEILAGALKDHQRGLLVGEKTFGKGSFQEGIIWNKNKKIAFFQTKGFYFLPSGFSPQLVGLEPDVKVSFKDKFALRESEQYVYPLEAPGVEAKGNNPFVEVAKVTSMLKNVTAESLVSCMSFESEFVAPEDPEIREAHRLLNCGGIAGRGEQ